MASAAWLIVISFCRTPSFRLVGFLVVLALPGLDALLTFRKEPIFELSVRVEVFMGGREHFPARPGTSFLFYVVA